MMKYRNVKHKLEYLQSNGPPNSAEKVSLFVKHKFLSMRRGRSLLILWCHLSPFDHPMTGLCPFKLFKDTKMFMIRDLMAFPVQDVASGAAYEKKRSSGKTPKTWLM